MQPKQRIITDGVLSAIVLHRVAPASTVVGGRRWSDWRGLCFVLSDKLLDEELSSQWLLKHFHPDGLKCPRCGSREEEARMFRRTRRSGLVVYRCRPCDQTYSLYSGTVFEHRQLTPMQVLLLVRGVCKGEPSATLARELGVTRGTVHTIRKALQANAQALQPATPLFDQATETDEMFQNAGEKRR